MNKWQAGDLANLTRTLAVVFAVLLVGFAAPNTASAQEAGEGIADFNAQTFQPVIGPHGTFTLDRAETIGHLETTGGLYLDYLSEPFVVTDGDGDSQAIIDQQLAADLVAGIGFFDRARLGVHLPVYFVNSGDYGADGSFSGSGIGDLTFQPKLRLLKQPEAPLGLGLLLDVSVPTGDANRFIGSTTVTAAPMALVDRTIGKTTIETNLGFRFQEEQTVRDVEIGDRFTYGLGAEYALVENVLQVGLEVFGHTPLQDPFGMDRSSPLETLVGAKVTPGSGISISSGVGAGLIGGIGAPEFRAFLGVSYAPTDKKAQDPDGDGITGQQDECPNKAEDLDGFEDGDGCPDPDNDGDGVPDDKDACPNKAADDGQADGCPAEDKKADKKKDEAAEQKAKQQAEETKDKGKAVATPAKPKDSDGDGVPDETDKCPEMVGVAYRQGCPPTSRLVELKEDKINVLEKIYFKTDSAELKEESFKLLDQVALLLRLNPQIERVEIQGHTDDTGTEKYNQKLSEKRAASVQTYLVEEADIAADRLTAEGYGASQPKVPNVSEENRAKNRRVEFVIVMKGPTDGSREGSESKDGEASDASESADETDEESQKEDEQGGKKGDESSSESDSEGGGSGDSEGDSGGSDDSEDSGQTGE